MMKNIYTTLFALALSAMTAGAQDISIKNPKAGINGGDVEIALTIEAAGLELGCDGRLKLEFVMEGEGNRLVLPAVVYTGKTRNMYERRNEMLSGRYVMPYYHIENNVKKNRTYTLEYAVSVPYYPWMEHAAVRVGEYLYGCSGDRRTGGGTVVAEIERSLGVEVPAEWSPRPEVYRKMICFMVPEVEEVKKRTAAVELNIGYPVNIYDVIPSFGDNGSELLKADVFMSELKDSDLITVDNIDITGYASPDGPYAGNEKLARNRAEGFKRYMINKYGGICRGAGVKWTAEDWTGFRRMVSESDMAGKNEVLSIIDNEALSPDAKDRALQAVHPWTSVYGVILNDMYPRLRRIEMTAEYTVSNIGDDMAKELIYTDPEMLSLAEMYRVANLYEPGSAEYLDAYRIAAKQFGNDIVANNNAAAALLMSGDAEGAEAYMEKLERNIGGGAINLGAYHYIKGDLTKAEYYFRLAKEAGIEQAEQNLYLLNSQRR